MALIKTGDLIAKFQTALRQKWGYIWGTAGIAWTEARQADLEKTTDSSRANSRKYGSKWIGHVVADCSGMFTWAFKQLGGKMYHGSDTMYLKWCQDKGALKAGKRTDGKPLKPGTAVFVWNGEKYSHVGLFVGDGKVIEAEGARAGVVASDVTKSKWTHWGELTGVDYSGAETGDAAGTDTETGAMDPGDGFPRATIRKGAKGADVRAAQMILYNLGYDLGSYGVDGEFGRMTELAVMVFQRDHGLETDGVIGPLTWAELERARENLQGSAGQKTYTVRISGLDLAEAQELALKYAGRYEMSEEAGVK